MNENGIGFVSASQLMSHGDYHKRRLAVEQGDLVKVKHGIYATPDSLVSNMTDVEALIPGGVVCLYTAWAYYQLTTIVAPEICVAVKAKRKVVTPALIPIKLYYWKDEYLEFGIAKDNYSGFIVNMTDIERSVCDAIRYRNKIGHDLCAEIIVNYLKRPNRNIARLMNYAKRLRVSNTLSNYLEIMM